MTRIARRWRGLAKLAAPQVFMFNQVLGSLFPADQAGVGLNSIIQLLINKLTVFIKLLTDKITKTIHFKLSPRRFPRGVYDKSV